MPLDAEGFRAKSVPVTGDEAITITIPFHEIPKGLKIRHGWKSDGSPETMIARSLEHPELCRLCPRELCNHNGGFCVVFANGHIPANLCAFHSLRRRIVETKNLPGPRVDVRNDIVAG